LLTDLSPNVFVDPVNSSVRGRGPDHHGAAGRHQPGHDHTRQRRPNVAASSRDVSRLRRHHDYVATDQNGLTSTSTRTVIIEAPAAAPPAKSGTTTEATFSPQIAPAGRLDHLGGMRGNVVGSAAPERSPFRACRCASATSAWESNQNLTQPDGSSDVTACPQGVKTGNTQNEHKFSGLPRKADLAVAWLCRLVRLAAFVGHPARGLGYFNSKIVHSLVDRTPHGQIAAAAPGGKTRQAR
jgi:hypothetical protein